MKTDINRSNANELDQATMPMPIRLLLYLCCCCLCNLALLNAPDANGQEPISPADLPIAENQSVGGDQADENLSAIAESSGAEAGDEEGEDSDEDLDLDLDNLDDELDSLLDKDLGSLRRTSVAPSLDVEVSSVSRQKSTIGRSPTAIFVVTEEMIRRSGYQSIPEVLRLVPGLQVARIDGNKWSISCRGQSGRFNDKLLVQLDGRSIYNPLFAGVLWDVQDVLLEDVLRIEVIRGPGATVWGANAVNGVINIITKSSSETHGTYAIGGGGSLERGFAGGRIGGQTKNGVDYRVWGKWYQRGPMDLVGDRPYDSIEQGRTGFRMDWSEGRRDQFTLQGQYYNGESRNLADRDFSGRVRFDEPTKGGNLLSRWTRTYSEDRESSLQLYYDRFDRNTFGFGQQTNIFDIDYQYRFRYCCNHSIIWGLGYRAIFDKLVNNDPLPYIAVDPERQTVQRFSGFIQDEITLLTDKLYLTVGSKFSHNTFSNFEVQPSIRLLWLPNERSAAWCSASRAVRTPSRATANGRIVVQQPTPPLGPFPLRLFGDGNLKGENLHAYEFGYRQQTNEFFSWDFAAYFNQYYDLQDTGLVIPSVGLPFVQLIGGNKSDGYGFELSGMAQLTPKWTMTGWYRFHRLSSFPPPEATPSTFTSEDSSARNIISITNSFDLRCGRQFDVITRYVDHLPGEGVPAYTAVDARFAWNLGRDLTASIVGRNLFDPRHPEFGTNEFTGDVPTEVPRSVHAYLEWRR